MNDIHSYTYDYYFNDTPEHGLVRNNLIYTSLINKDKTVFVKWYHNDLNYHGGHNEVVDINLMDFKWQREVRFLKLMTKEYPDLVPEIIDIDYENRKIYLKIEGIDFWQLQLNNNCSFDQILPDWQDQMLNIIKAHKNLDIFKYSMHPSSYFIINGKLKSINYFFCYTSDDENITVRDQLSHISHNRRKSLFQKMEEMNIDVDKPTDPRMLQLLCFESFRTNYPDDFIEKAKAIYV
jgi:hypothetical protein